MPVVHEDEAPVGAGEADVAVALVAVSPPLIVAAVQAQMTEKAFAVAVIAILYLLPVLMVGWIAYAFATLLVMLFVGRSWMLPP